MYARILTGSLYGLEAELTWVEVDSENGLPAFSVVGLANQAIKEAKDRIHSAVLNCGYGFPPRRITVNLTPAGRKKEGSHYDLAIALGLLISTGQVPMEEVGDLACFGELSLDGKVSGGDGILPMLISLEQQGVRRVMVPSENMAEARLAKGLEIIGVESLAQAADHISGFKKLPVIEADGLCRGASAGDIPDFADIRGQENVKRAAQLAAAGRHGMLMIGPPGVGKSMVGKRIPGIMPPMTFEEMLDVTRVYSISGELKKDAPLITLRPYRAPHHSLSTAALVGGGSRPVPGEISLAHRGVLFLDELPEFSAGTLDNLRQPLEDGSISITRVGGKCRYPAEFMLVAAMNPCRCGWYGDPVRQCKCTEADRKKYIGRVSGPLLDRIDIHVAMERVVYDQLDTSSDRSPIDSASLRRGVETAVEMQRERYKDDEICWNSRLGPGGIKKYCSLDREGSELMKEAFARLNLSARSYHRILRLARTSADVAGSDSVEAEHLLEALSYRPSEKYFL